MTTNKDHIWGTDEFPECIDCGEQMTFYSSHDVYACAGCFDQKCTCMESPPCSWCVACVPSDVWDEERAIIQRTLKHVRRESGPSAVAAAKPVTPKYHVFCQGDWHDGLENL